MKTVQAKISDEDKTLLDDEIERQGITISQHIRNLIRGDNRWRETEKLLLKQQSVLLEILRASIKGSLTATAYLAVKEGEAQAKSFNTILNDKAGTALLKALTRIEGGNNVQQ